jgi:hypothetical protein
MVESNLLDEVRLARVFQDFFRLEEVVLEDPWQCSCYDAVRLWMIVHT